MFSNPYILLLAGLVPIIVGFVWYGPLFGKPWMRVNGFTEESLKGGNMVLIMGLSYFLSIILATGLMGLTNHQSGVMQLFASHPDFEVIGSEVNTLYNTVMDNFGDRHRDFKHGALHGGLAAILIALPLIAINALFERRGGKYIGIHFGYWFVTLILMGGVVCQWL